jgi:hypothetical protein
MAFLIIFPMVVLGTQAAKAATYSGDSYYGLTATTLGDGYHLISDATGYITAVTSADGSQTYQFDKYPVIHELVQTYPIASQEGIISVPEETDYDVLTNKYGTASFKYIQSPTYGRLSIAGHLANWSLEGFNIPVYDFNIHGVVVGTNGSAASSKFGYYQTLFTTPGLVFNTAFMVADTGQVLVSGTLDGEPQDFLLTQGQPILAPEPSTLAILVCAILSLGPRLARASSRQ